MYEAFYNLGRDPFRLLPDAGICFPHRSWERTWTQLRYALDRGEGIAVVTGPPGSGKTTLADRLLAEVDTAGAVGARLIADEQSATEVLRKLAHACGLPADGLDRAMLRHRIESHLLELGQAGGRVVVIIDEAQALAPEALEAMRLLTDLQAQSRPMLQLFLFGQEDLQEAMAAPWMEQFQDRLVVRCRLRALDLADTKSYLEYRLGSAGWRGDPAIDGPAVAAIYRHTGGLPRQLNKVCGRLLLYGSGEGRHALGEPDVRAVVSELCDEWLVPAGESRAAGDASQAPFESVDDLALEASSRSAASGSTALAVAPVFPLPSLSTRTLPRLIDRLRGQVVVVAARAASNLPAQATAGLMGLCAAAVVVLLVAGGDDEPVAARVGATAAPSGGRAATGQAAEAHLTLDEGPNETGKPAVAGDVPMLLPGMAPPDPGMDGDGRALFGGWWAGWSVDLPIAWSDALDDSLRRQAVADAGDGLTGPPGWRDDTMGMAAAAWADQAPLIDPEFVPLVTPPVDGDVDIALLADTTQDNPLDFAGFLPAPAAGRALGSPGRQTVAPTAPAAIFVEAEPLPEEIPLVEGAPDPVAAIAPAAVPATRSEALAGDAAESAGATPKELAADPGAAGAPSPATGDTPPGWAAELVALGDAALAGDRLLLPEAESAYAYYQRALAIDARDQGALAGMAQIVNRYAFLADRALHNGELDRAERFVRRAQRVAPEDAGLRVLRGKVDRAVAQAEAEAATALEEARLARMAAEVSPPEPVVVSEPQERLSNFERVMQYVNGSGFGGGR